MCVKSISSGGGIGKNYRLWFEMFQRNGVDVTLFILEGSELESSNVILLKGKSIKEKGEYLRDRLQNMDKFDLFLLNAEYLKEYIDQDYFITVHNSWELRGNPIRRYLRFRKLKRKYEDENLIGISKSVLDNITNNLKIRVKSKTVIYAPHDIKRVRELANIEMDDENRDFIVSIGSLIKRKNYKLLIESFKLIEDRVDLDLIIIGEGKERKNLEKLIEKLDLKERIKLIGFRENPYPYIKNAKLLVSSSNSEGLPRVIVEAFILNTPVVTTYSSKGIDEVMEGELQNFVVPKNSKEELAYAILRTLEGYPPIKDTLYSKFSMEESFKKFMSLARDGLLTYH